jgi:hypothetical protein
VSDTSEIVYPTEKADMADRQRPDRPARRHLVDLPEPRGYRVKRRLLGEPLRTDQLSHERLGKPTALAVFASDNLSSSAVRPMAR